MRMRLITKQKGWKDLNPTNTRKIFLNPGNNMPFVEVQNTNLEDDVYNTFQDAVDLTFRENINLPPS